MITPKINDIYPTDESLDACWFRLKSSLPITDENQLFALFNIHQNTILNELKKVSNTESNQGTSQ